VPDAFLQKIGLQTADGQIKAHMQVKPPWQLPPAVVLQHNQNVRSNTTAGTSQSLTLMQNSQEKCCK
jgi:hypothetical protein